MRKSPVAFITGSGRRLGRRLAYAFADAGYGVVLHAEKSALGMEEARKRISDAGGSAWIVRGDLADLAVVRSIAAEAVAFNGRMDALVNCAGVFPEASFEDVDGDMWDKAMNVNLKAAFFLVQSCAPALRAARGAVVNVACAGAFSPWSRHIPYNISKAGVVMLTRALARALAPDVRVNAVAPGIMEVPGEETRPLPPADRIPLKRHGTPEDLAAAVLFLARDAMYLTGHTMPVDGGFLEA